MRVLLGKDWSPGAIYVPHAPPEDIQPYKSRFNCPVFFNWESMMMSFDAEMLCYSELSVVSNAFRQHHGMSPREWKNRTATRKPYAQTASPR